MVRCTATRRKVTDVGTQQKDDTPRILIWLGVVAVVAAAVMAGVQNAGREYDNPYMRGDQSADPNYAPAIVVAVAGAFLILLGVIMGPGRRP